MKRVWILGAGFSRPLGGPLLNDLLSSHMQLEIQARFGGELLRERANFAVLHLHAEGRRQGAWPHAERFLAFLDVAAADPGGGYDRRLQEIAKFTDCTTAEINAHARRLVALECAAFLHDQRPEWESWLPYHSWAENLTSTDVVLSFNYDRVLETLRDHRAREAESNEPALRVVTSETEWATAGATRVLKLHGSLDWKVDPQTGGFSVDKPDLPQRATGNEIAIGTPGVQKMTTAGGAFASLWERARRALEVAREVHVVGFRFPESDAFAREELLFRTLRKSSHLEKVFTVLGDPSPASARLHALLSRALPERVKPEAVPLGAEEYLHAWQNQDEA
ncbi:MAG: hypothetical protein HYZ29_27835 [Myxococcales bacterium]|nr:hypothetical protein [Myxococcales bacterium]